MSAFTASNTRVNPFIGATPKTTLLCRWLVELRADAKITSGSYPVESF